MTAAIGHVVGHKVRHVRTPIWMFYKAAKAQGLKPILLSGLSHYFQDHDRGAFAVGAPNDTVRELTGRKPEDFGTIARRHAGIARIAPQLPRAARWPRALHGGADPGGVQSCDLRQGARAAPAADTTSRARRRRLDGEPQHRGPGGGAKSVEGGIRMKGTPRC
jgi:hypothetical protein